MAYIQNTIPSQLPAHIVKDYPLFVEFLKAYYQWMEQNGSPYFAINNHLDWLNFENSMDDYVDFLRKEYIFNMPADITGGLELLLKNSKQFHLTVGTEESFKFIFKILFGESAGDVELYFPRREILKVSDSSWNNGEFVMYITDSGKSDKFLYRVVKQTREIFPGIFRYAYAIVQRIVSRYAGKFKVTELYLTEIQGEFEIGYPVEVENTFEWILPTANLISIQNPGELYYVDDKITLGINPSFIQSVLAERVGRVDTRISSIYEKAELQVTIDGVEVDDYNYDGRNLSHPSIIIGSEIEIVFPTFAGYLHVKSTGILGDVKEIEVTDSPIGLDGSADISITGRTGSGFVGQISESLMRQIPGYYVDDKGHLSSTKVLQDSNYYQDFSYVIKSSLGVDAYKDAVLKLLHPAGMKLFGQVNIIELIKLMIRDSLEIDIPPRNVIQDLSEVVLYTDHSYIDKKKHVLNTETWKTFNFRESRVRNFIDNDGKKRLNVQDVSLIVESPYYHTLDVANQFSYDINVPFAQDII